MSIMQEEQSCFIISQYIEISDSDETIDPTDIAQEISDSDETIDPTDIAQEVPASKRKINPTADDVDDDVQTKSGSDSIIYQLNSKLFYIYIVFIIFNSRVCFHNKHLIKSGNISNFHFIRYYQASILVSYKLHVCLYLTLL